MSNHPEIPSLWHRIFGFPIWTEDFDGELRRGRGHWLPDGQLVISKIYGHVLANADGTVPKGYIKRWWRR